MNRSIPWCLKSLTVLVFVIGMNGLAQANLVLNGDFSTGTFANWSLSGDSNEAYVTSDGQGNYVAALSTASTEGFMSQTLATTTGQIYTYSFILASDSATPNSLSVTLGGTPLVNLTNVTTPTSTSYTTYTGNYTATSGSSVLQFGFTDNPGYLYVTDISVIPMTSVPEPASIVGLGLGVLVLWGRSRRKRQVPNEESLLRTA